MFDILLQVRKHFFIFYNLRVKSFLSQTTKISLFTSTIQKQKTILRITTDRLIGWTGAPNFKVYLIFIVFSNPFTCLSQRHTQFRWFKRSLDSTFHSGVEPEEYNCIHNYSLFLIYYPGVFLIFLGASIIHYSTFGQCCSCLYVTLYMLDPC